MMAWIPVLDGERRKAAAREEEEEEEGCSAARAARGEAGEKRPVAVSVASALSAAVQFVPGRAGGYAVRG